MEKVYISCYVKTGALVSAIGFVDTQARTLYIPKVSKNGKPYIAEVVVSILEKTNNGYIGIEVCEGDKGTYTLTYHCNYLTKKGA